MKYIKYLILAVVCGVVLSSCHKKEDEPYYTEKPILQQASMLSAVIDWKDITAEQQQQIDYLTKHVFIVNDMSKMPECSVLDDPLNDGSLDLTERSLIVTYSVWEDCILNAQEYQWLFETVQEIYIFNIVSYVDVNDLWEEKRFCLVRSAILVDKIPDSARLDVWHSATVGRPTN